MTKRLPVDTDALKPNTIAVARLKYPPALKPKSAGQVGVYLWEAESSFNVSRAKENQLVRE